MASSAAPASGSSTLVQAVGRRGASGSKSVGNFGAQLSAEKHHAAFEESDEKNGEFEEAPDSERLYDGALSSASRLS